jgi:hypothetical protein
MLYYFKNFSSARQRKKKSLEKPVSEQLNIPATLFLFATCKYFSGHKVDSGIKKCLRSDRQSCM